MLLYNNQVNLFFIQLFEIFQLFFQMIYYWPQVNLAQVVKECGGGGE
jgi:hypothetical protein